MIAKQDSLRLARADAPRDAPAMTVSDAAAPLATSASAMLRRVLCIEDNAVNALVMHAMLERIPGVRSFVATMPQQGLDLARSERPDLVLLDIQMPGMNSFEVLRHWRADARTRDIPVIAVSANAMQADVDAGLSDGFAACLTKPVDLDHLTSTVQRWLARSRAGPGDAPHV